MSNCYAGRPQRLKIHLTDGVAAGYGKWETRAACRVDCHCGGSQIVAAGRAATSAYKVEFVKNGTSYGVRIKMDDRTFDRI